MKGALSFSYFTRSISQKISSSFPKNRLGGRGLVKWTRTYDDEGVAVPHWWLGYGYYEFDREATVYYIIPVNLIVAVSRWLWLIIRFRFSMHFAELSRVRYYQRGYKDGYNHALSGDVS